MEKKKYHCKKRIARSEVPVEHTWKLEDLFATDDEWNNELKAIQNDLPTVTQYRGKLSEGGKKLY